MKVVITGAAGKLGSRLMTVLTEAGHAVTGVDRRRPQETPAGEFREVDLLDGAAVRRGLDGAEAVVHLANWSCYREPPGQRVFIENVMMNDHVLEAARLGGTKRLVFASSVQAFSQGFPLQATTWECHLPYLPIDGDIPARPRNPYGLSKQVGEAMLAFYAREYGMSAVAIRYPALVEDDRGEARPWTREPRINQVDDGFGWLAFSDAARLVEAILRADLPGMRIYHPASPEPMCRLTVAELLEKYYRGVPRKNSAEPVTSLYDVTQITKETGWTPVVRMGTGA